MDPFREKAFYLFVWRAWLVGLVATVFMVTRSFELGLALLVGGKVALIFSLALVLYAGWLTDNRVVRVEPWRTLVPHERPTGPAGQRWARNYLERVALQFAQAASGVAIALLGSALLVVCR